MFCLRCGVETNENQVFCDKCLENMERHPIKSGTPVKLPNRELYPAPKKQARRKTLTMEEQNTRLKVLARTLFALLGAVSVVLGIFIWLYFQSASNTSKVPEASKGTNYSVVTDETTGTP